MFSLKENNWLVYILLAVVIFIWGLNYSLVKWAVAEVPPIAFNVVRYSLASLVILGILFVRKDWRSLNAGDFVSLALLGVLGHSIYQVLFIKGISLTTAGNTSLFLATTPIWTALISSVFDKDRLTKKAWAGIVLSFLGVIVVTIGGGEVAFGGPKALGDLLILSAALSLSCYTVLSRGLLKKISPLRLTAYTMAIGSLGLWIYGSRAVLSQNWASVSLEAWAVMVYSALLAVVLGYLVWFTAVKSVGPSRTAVFSNVTPIIAFSLAFLLLREPVSPLQILGAAIVIGGVTLTVRN